MTDRGPGTGQGSATRNAWGNVPKADTRSLADIQAEQRQESIEAAEYQDVRRRNRPFHAGPAVHGAATVTATLRATSKQGESGNHAVVAGIFRSHCKSFHDALEAMVQNRKTKGGGKFSCAEPHAIALLVQTLPTVTVQELAKIRLTKVLNDRSSLVEPLCMTCQQWLCPTGSGTYQIDPEVLRRAQAIEQQRAARKQDAVKQRHQPKPLATNNRFAPLEDTD